MRNWKARLLAMFTATAALIAVSAPAAVGDDWSDDYGYYGWYDYYYPYYYWGDDWS
jgi:hypothetical protein